MKKAIVVLFLFLSCFVAAQSTTPNIGVSLLPHSYPNWDVATNNNMTLIDQVVGSLQTAFQGPWSSSTTYSKGQIVVQNGVLYFSLLNNNFNNSPGSAPIQWKAASLVGNDSTLNVFGTRHFAGDGTAAAPSFTFTNNTGSGIYNVAGTISFAIGGALKAFINGNVNLATDIGMYTFGASNDTSFSRNSAGIIAVGNGTTGNESGTLLGTAFNARSSAVTVGSLGGDANGALELGPLTGITKTPFLDFHFHDGTDTQGNQDYNVRLVNDGNNSLLLKGGAGVSTPVFRLGNQQDTGISRVGAGQVGVGNGTPGDTTGTLIANSVRGGSLSSINAAGLVSLGVSADTGISRVAPGQIGVGNGTAGDTTGLVDASSFFVPGDLMRMDTTGLRLNNAKVVGWSSTTAAGAAFDTGFSRTAAGVVASGNGTAADTSGTFAAARFLFSGSDAAISRTAAGEVGIGNGTAGDSSGALKLNKITGYAGSTTAGLGIPFVINATQVTGVTANTGTVTLIASAPVGTYEVSIYMYPTTVGTAGNATLNIAYNNGSFAHSFTTNSLVLSASGVIQNLFVLKSAAAQAITYAITITGATGSPVVAADIIIKKIN
jgi:hypothetical protein